MGLSLISKPSFNPISLDEVKDRLRITNSQEDDQILSMITSATQWAEHDLNWRICTQTWDYYLDGWPTEYSKGLNYIRMPYPPLQSVTHIKYYNESNVLTALVEDTDYRIDSVSYPARIEGITSWPTYYDRFNPIVIRFICGFSSTDLIPEDIKDAIYLRVADLYEYRQDSLVGVQVTKNTESAYSILMRYRLYNAVI